MEKKSWLSRRTFIKGAAAMGFIAAGGYFLPETMIYRKAANKARELVGDINAQYVRQLAGICPASRTIMWQSESSLEAPAIEYGLADSDDTRTADAVDSSFEDDGQYNNQYTATITGFEKGKEYRYRMISQDAKSDWYKLYIPNDHESFKMLIFPDSQSNDYSGWEELAQDAWSRNPDTTLFTNMGDLVDNGEDSTQWHAWFNGVSGLIANAAFAPVMGNHETYNQDWKVRLPEAYLSYFDVPENGSEKFARYYYSFNYGDVHFIVLNTQEQEVSDFIPGLYEEQLAWLEKDLKGSTAKWKVVMMHRDVLQYRIHKRPERKEGISDEGSIFMPIFDKYNVDVVFTAHLHTYRDRGHIFDFKNTDGKGPLYILTGVAGNVRYPGLWVDHAMDKYVAPQPETDNYLTMEASSSALDIRCFLPDGTEIDRATVTKS